MKSFRQELRQEREEHGPRAQGKMSRKEVREREKQGAEYDPDNGKEMDRASHLLFRRLKGA